MTFLKIDEAIFRLFIVLQRGLIGSQQKRAKTSYSTANFSELPLIQEGHCGSEKGGVGTTHSRGT